MPWPGDEMFVILNSIHTSLLLLRFIVKSCANMCYEFVVDWRDVLVCRKCRAFYSCTLFMLRSGTVTGQVKVYFVLLHSYIYFG